MDSYPWQPVESGRRARYSNLTVQAEGSTGEEEPEWPGMSIDLTTMKYERIKDIAAYHLIWCLAFGFLTVRSCLVCGCLTLTLLMAGSRESYPGLVGGQLVL